MLRTKFQSQKQLIAIVTRLQLDNPNFEEDMANAELSMFRQLNLNDQRVYTSELLRFAKTYKWNWKGDCPMNGKYF